MEKEEYEARIDSINREDIWKPEVEKWLENFKSEETPIEKRITDYRINGYGTNSNNDNKILCVSAYLDGEYGEKDIYLGTPAVIDKDGIQKVVELPLDSREQEALINSASVLRETTANGMTKAGLLNYLWK